MKTHLYKQSDIKGNKIVDGVSLIPTNDKETIFFEDIVKRFAPKANGITVEVKIVIKKEGILLQIPNENNYTNINNIFYKKERML